MSVKFTALECSVMHASHMSTTCVCRTLAHIMSLLVEDAGNRVTDSMKANCASNLASSSAQDVGLSGAVRQHPTWPSYVARPA